MTAIMKSVAFYLKHEILRVTLWRNRKYIEWKFSNSIRHIVLNQPEGSAYPTGERRQLKTCSLIRLWRGSSQQMHRTHRSRNIPTQQKSSYVAANREINYTAKRWIYEPWKHTLFGLRMSKAGWSSKLLTCSTLPGTSDMACKPSHLLTTWTQ